jgi:allantoin racemase
MGGRRLAFINPFGTEIYDGLIRDTLLPYAADDSEVDVVHIENAPPNIDYYWPKHLIEAAVFERVMELEGDGYHGVVIGCCYDPGVRVARELVDIPVVGPLESAMNMASYFGHSYTIVTDHRKAVPYLEDLVRLYGGESCRGVRCIDWWVTEMVKDPAAVAKDAAAECLRALEEDGSEVAILGCTIIGGCLEGQIRETGEYGDLPILNPNLLALKTAETLADLHIQGKYTISRKGYYQKQAQHDPNEFADYRARYRLVELEPETEG